LKGLRAEIHTATPGLKSKTMVNSARQSRSFVKKLDLEITKPFEKQVLGEQWENSALKIKAYKLD